ncbi:hypothetical protein BJ878DRAFT_539588 [Calycina marina]|uniref:SH3 domain-containing protein n=1 Tax=Calycina marina TaxID=1763456 RepID=A0A9P8CJ47_9HELO|nr:hypothetical protein BJ878DRAFT_539588 [Calycina marina]
MDDRRRLCATISYRDQLQLQLQLVTKWNCIQHIESSKGKLPGANKNEGQAEKGELNPEMIMINRNPISNGPAAKDVYEDRPTSNDSTTTSSSVNSTEVLESLDNLSEDLNLDQASSLVRSSSRHIVNLAVDFANSPQGPDRSSSAGAFPRNVSQPILPTGTRSASFHVPTQTEDLSTCDFREIRNRRTRNRLHQDTTVGSNFKSGREAGSPEKFKRPYKHKLIPADTLSIQKTRPYTSQTTERSAHLYFTHTKLHDIGQKVPSTTYNCTKHQDCTDCRNIEYAYPENKTMSTFMLPEERNKIIGNNRSLRNIKNELETLAENGAISDAAFDEIMKYLPAESTLGATSRGGRAAAPPPSASMEKLSMNDNPPPSYQSTGPPALPTRNSTSTPKPKEVMRASALYTYESVGDCCFNVGDEIIVMKIVNDDWWVGKNAKTGSEGAFPKTYVQPRNGSSTGNYYNGENAVPPMQISEQAGEKQPSKGREMGEKFGKKLGSAAIFGAGATIGGNIVNGIF